MRDAAKDLYEQGYIPIPLGLDANGYAKRPLIKAWPLLPHNWEILKALPWKDAKGIGLVLGNGLEVIDVDNAELAQAMFAYLFRRMGSGLPRFVWTVSGNCHIYTRPSESAPSRFFRYQWGDTQVGIETKAQGNQVAAPPTPGYTLADPDAEPFFCKTIDQAAAPLFAAMGMVLLDEERGGGYPKPWAEQVPEGQRNKSIYVEAHQLREAGMGIEAALPVLRARFDNDYEGVWSSDMEKTIRSAYNKSKFVSAAHVDTSMLGHIYADATDAHGHHACGMCGSEQLTAAHEGHSWDRCRDCDKPAERYAPDTTPFCDDHGRVPAV